ncbi:MAG: RluA family pseudouridine synthase [Finegoldia sp.]|nr:RluA family pseudouridine synthase [Finegoldia sp.]
MKHIEIDERNSGQRLDRFISKLMPKMGKNMVQKFIRTKKIKVNKKRSEADYILKDTDIVNIYIYDEVIEKYQDKRVYTADDFNLKVVYEDDDIIIIDKPAGILSHAADKKDYGKNIVDMMVSYLIKRGAFVPAKDSTFTPALVNRLDRNTAGLILGAKTYDSLKYFNELFKRREVTKLYESLVAGRLSTGIIDLSLQKDEDKNISKVGQAGKKSMTKIISAEDLGGYSLVRIDLLTGRTHQIRAHLAAINNPIIGDIKYGDKKVNSYFQKKYGLNHQLLHSYKLIFPEKMEKYRHLEGRKFVSKRDSKFDQILKDLRKDRGSK